jgi:hypothetical protein
MSRLQAVGRAFIALTLCFASSGCVTVSEGAFRMRGRITVDGVAPHESCRIKAVRADTHGVAEELVIAADFQQSVVVEPGSHDYYFVISCPGAEDFTSTTYKVRGAQQYKKPIELGTISLRSKKR